jgi:hypothetical protein
MKTKTVVVTESGIPLNDKNDGFIMYGAIFKGDNEGGLFGDRQTMEKLVEAGVNGRAYTVFEFFDGLYLDPEVFYQYYLKNRKPGVRQDGMTSRGTSTKQLDSYGQDDIVTRGPTGNSTWGTDETGVFRDLSIGGRPTSSDH